MESIEALSQWLSEPLILFVLVLTRMSVMVMAMPAIGSGIPMKIRAFLAIAFTLLIIPLVDPGPSLQQGTFLDLVIAAFREAAIGMLIGLVIRLLVTGMQMAGEMASNGGGMQLGESIDPELRTSVSTLSRLISMMVTTTFILLGGHRMMLEALMDSFHSMPPGEIRFHSGMMELIVFELSAGIEAGLRTGAPLIAALLLSNLVTGLISRTLPQLNLLAIGLPVNAVVLLVVSGLSLGCGVWVFQDVLIDAMHRLGGQW